MNWNKDKVIYYSEGNEFTAHKNGNPLCPNKWSLYDCVEQKLYYLSTLTQCKEVAESLSRERSVQNDTSL